MQGVFSKLRCCTMLNQRKLQLHISCTCSLGAPSFHISTIFIITPTNRSSIITMFIASKTLNRFLNFALLTGHRSLFVSSHHHITSNVGEHCIPCILQRGCLFSMKFANLVQATTTIFCTFI